MVLGFARAKDEPAKQSAKQAKLTLIAEIQANLSSYFSEIKVHSSPLENLLDVSSVV